MRSTNGSLIGPLGGMREDGKRPEVWEISHLLDFILHHSAIQTYLYDSV